MTKSQLFLSAHALTRRLVRTGISYRATFGLALSHLAKTDMMPTRTRYDITATFELKRRKNGSVSFFKGRLSTDAGGVAFQHSTRLTDPLEDTLEIQGDVLIAGGDVADSVIRHIELLISRQRDAASALVEDEDEDLPAIIGVSEKQAAYAEAIRSQKLPQALAKCDDFLADFPQRADQIEQVRRELRTNTSARFWLDTLNPGPGWPAHLVLMPIVQMMMAEGRMERSA